MRMSRRGFRIAMETEAKFHGKKWNEIFHSEEELLQALKEIPQIDASHIPYTGYVYINSFAKRVQEGKELTEKQITQAKRIAIQIRIAYEVRNEWE